METLIVFLFIFVPMGWLIWGMLRFTRDTIGTNSPLKVKRIYRIRESAYFFKFDNLFAGFNVVLGLFLIRSGLTLPIAPDVHYPLLARAIILLTSAFIAGVGIFIWFLDFNHWKYVDGVVIETFPEEHELEITFGDFKLRLKEGDIVRVLVTSNDAKMRVSFMTYYLTNGNHFILSGKMPGVWVIHEYFKKIPTEHHKTQFPFIR